MTRPTLDSAIPKDAGPGRVERLPAWSFRQSPAFPGLGRIRKEGSSCAWVPVEYGPPR